MSSNLNTYNTTNSQAISKSLPQREVIILGLILIALQILDGILTNIGMNLFGTQMEGNTLLRSVMENYGAVTALVISKALAILTIISLVYMSNQVKWIRHAFKGVIAIYFTFAIAPWTLLISQAI